MITLLVMVRVPLRLAMPAAWLAVLVFAVPQRAPPIPLAVLPVRIGRLVEPQEIADVIALLVSPRSASTTGSDFVVDGGFLKEI